MRISILDIETSPHIAYVWGAWKQNVGRNQWVERGYIISFAEKEFRSNTINYEEARTPEDELKLLLRLWKILDEADVVVAHYGDKFDIPTITGRFLAHGLKPPSPYHTVDTKAVASRKFRVVSNSLETLCEEFGVKTKDQHKEFPGFELWRECLKGNDRAWEVLKEYNIADILSLEELYEKMLPYIDNHPNVGEAEGEEERPSCPKCGSNHIQWRGSYTTRSGLVYPKFSCTSCGGWGRVNRMYKRSVVPSNTGRNAK